MLITRTVGRIVEPLSGRSWSPAAVMDRARARSMEYGALGLTRGDRVFVHYGNSLEFFVDLLAIWHAGACVVPIDSRLTPFEVQTLAALAKPKVSVWSESPDGQMLDALSELSVDVISKPGAGSPSIPLHTQSRLCLDDPALILFTSGTTGNPKGVVHTHRSLRARWTSLAASLDLECFTRTLCLLPTHFGHGLICNCLFPWLYGKDLYILPPFRGDMLMQLGELIDTHGITFLSSVPTVWRLATKIAKPPKKQTLLQVFCGSAPLSQSLWRSVQNWAGTCNVINAYGITETGSWLAGTTMTDAQPEDGLIGQAWGGEIRVLRLADTRIPLASAEECAPGESGHIWVQTPALMKGYLERDDLTSQVVSEGWFSTGDIGLFDSRGYLYLRGRDREEINKGGMKVYPADIDAVIESFPGTMDVCAFAMNDELLGEDVGVAIVLESSDDATLVRLHQWCSQRLAAHQLPRKWFLLEDIPRTSRGKVNRANVATHCSSRTPVPYSLLLERAGSSPASQLDRPQERTDGPD